uniref:Probable glycerol kinase n=1 Tax=Schistosoma mansoni TaxID=6183 RepID=A0A3Q0KNN0_SCHMA
MPNYLFSTEVEFISEIIHILYVMATDKYIPTGIDKKQVDNNENEKFIAAIDQGTSSSRVIIFSINNGSIIAMHQISVTQSYPSPGWIEMDANQIYTTILECLNKCVEQLKSVNKSTKDIVGVGITNQRETTIAWNSETGEPLAPAIVWSDARTADDVKKFIRIAPGNKSNAFQLITGLPIHSYFSALKMNWLLNNVKSVAEADEGNKLLFGTVDSWLIWKLTSQMCHVTDVTNASRTLLFNLNTLEWDHDLCKFFHINPRTLPKIVTSSELIGVIQDSKCLMKGITIYGILGDQQASLVAQTWGLSCSVNENNLSDLSKVKVTYGTGAFMLWNIGCQPYFSDKGVLTTIAYKMGSKGRPYYALEGAISFAGATMRWLKTKLDAFKDDAECEKLSASVYRKQGFNEPDPCYLVPAFSGLFCPWWQESARCVICGITANVDKSDLIYAGLRSSVYQTYDVLFVATLAKANNKYHSLAPLMTLKKPTEIMVDGGMSNSDTLMQSLADILNVTVRRHNHSDVMTALGAAITVALALDIDPTGLLKIREYSSYKSDDYQSTFYSKISSNDRAVKLYGWHESVKRSLHWIPNKSINESQNTLLDSLDLICNEECENENRIKKNQCSLNSQKISFGLTAIGLFLLGLFVGQRIK